MKTAHFCSMKISQDIRAAAEAQNDVALVEAGMAEMSERCRAGGAAIDVVLPS